MSVLKLFADLVVDNIDNQRGEESSPADAEDDGNVLCGELPVGPVNNNHGNLTSMRSH